MNKWISLVVQLCFLCRWVCMYACMYLWVHIPTRTNTYIFIYHSRYWHCFLSIHATSPSLYSGHGCRVELNYLPVQGCPTGLKPILCSGHIFLVNDKHITQNFGILFNVCRREALILTLIATSSSFCWCQSDIQEESLLEHETDITEGRVKGRKLTGLNDLAELPDKTWSSIAGFPVTQAITFIAKASMSWIFCYL